MSARIGRRQGWCCADAGPDPSLRDGNDLWQIRRVDNSGEIPAKTLQKDTADTYHPPYLLLMLI
jgi:hypothetical protein